MALNKKLTPVIAGRAIQSHAQSGNVLSISFTNGSTLKIKTAGEPVDIPPGRTLQAVRQQAAVMNLDFTDGSTAQIHLAEATSSVMLRDAAGVMEYAD